MPYGTLLTDTINASTGVLATQNGMTGIAKAWVQLSGSATPTINGSFNVSSVTRNSAGDYTITFTTAMPNINYSATCTTTIDSTSSNYMTPQTFAKTASPYYLAPTTASFGVTFVTSGGVYKEPYYASLAVFSS